MSQGGRSETPPPPPREVSPARWTPNGTRVPAGRPMDVRKEDYVKVETDYKSGRIGDRTYRCGQ